jgi:hypothetical protein
MHRSRVHGDYFLLRRLVTACQVYSPLLSFLGFLPSLLVAASCAKVGEPQPPVLLVAKPASDLAARQYGDSIVLTVSLPTQNTNGSPVTTPQGVEIFRVSAGGSRMTAPLQSKEFLARADLILNVSDDKLTPFVHDQTFVFRDELPPSQRAGFYRETFDYAVRFTNDKSQTAGFSNQVIIAPLALPAPPVGLAAKVTPERILLTWTAPASNADGSIPPHIAGYNVYRSEDPKEFPPAPLNPVPLPKPEFEDRSFQFDKTYYYAVSVVGSLNGPYAESILSQPLQAVARDIFPPAPPQNLNAVAENGIVILFWVAPPDSDVAGYRVYRSAEGGKERELLQPGLVSTLSYRDGTAKAGGKYEYFVTAVDTHGNESEAARTTAEIP